MILGKAFVLTLSSAMDLTMLSLLDARERDIDAWESLFRQADERFIIISVQVPSGSNAGIIEANWLE